MEENFLQLNVNKTEVIVIGPQAERKRVQFYLPAKNVVVCDKVRNLNVIIDADLSYIHTNQAIQTAFYHLRNISRVRPFLSRASSEI